MKKFLVQHKTEFLYGACMAALLLLLRWLELRLTIFRNAYEIYIVAIAAIFTGLGIWIALRLVKPKVQTVIIEKEVQLPAMKEFTLNAKELELLNISKRELEVLECMAGGLSNQEIAEKLFVSLNTIKTHSRNLFEKMEVSRRTQAIDKAKKIGLIP